MNMQPAQTAPQGAKNPKLPEGTWAITKEDKEKIVRFGRQLTGFVLEYAKVNGQEGKFHTKVIAGGFEYFMSLQKQKATLIGDDVLMAQDTMEKYNLGAIINEPFVPTKEELEAAAALAVEAAKAVKDTETAEKINEAVETAPLEGEGTLSDADVEDASVTPSTEVPVEAETPTEAPKTEDKDPQA